MKILQYQLIGTGVFLVLCLLTAKRRRQIWLWLCLLLIAVSSLEPQKDFGLSLLTAAIGFIPLLIATGPGNGGWADALLSGTLGYVLPFRVSLYLFLAASVSALSVLSVRAMRKNDKEQSLPYAPFLCVGWVTVQILRLTGVF